PRDPSHLGPPHRTPSAVSTSAAVTCGGATAGGRRSPPAGAHWKHAVCASPAHRAASTDLARRSHEGVVAAPPYISGDIEIISLQPISTQSARLGGGRNVHAERRRHFRHTAFDPLSPYLGERIFDLAVLARFRLQVTKSHRPLRGAIKRIRVVQKE